MSSTTWSRFVLSLSCILFIPLSARSDEISRIADPAVKHGSAAVVVKNAPLIHTSQILPTSREGEIVGRGDAARQVEQVFKNLSSALSTMNTSMARVIKLNVYVKDAAVRKEFEKNLDKLFPQGEAPAVAIVATPLPKPGALIALDAVAALDKEFAEPKSVNRIGRRAGGTAQVAVLPRGDVVYVAGQAERGDLATATRDTLKSLLNTLKHLGLDRSHVVQLKCFMKPMSSAGAVEREIVQFFEGQTAPPVAYVEWISTLPIEIELVAHAPPKALKAKRDASSVSYITPPGMKASPVFSRVAVLHGPARIYVSGLNAEDAADAEQEVRNVFSSLEKIVEKAGSDLRHLAKATYYVSTNDSSQKLNDVRPSIYDPKRPPAASKAMVKDTSWPGVSLTMDMIAAPK